MPSIINETATDLDFDVAISGLTGRVEPRVRFVIEDVNGYDVCINCTHTRADRWQAKVPALRITEDRRPFRVEVIADGYYFCPVEGSLRVEHTPQVCAEAVVSAERRRPEVKSSLAVTMKATPVRRLVEMDSMTDASRSKFVQGCALSSDVLDKAGNVLRKLGESGTSTSTMSSQKLVSVINAVQTTMSKLEEQLYR